MHTWLIIGIGGFFGAILRYLTGGWIQSSYASFPIGTLGVNLIGSFLIGIVIYLSEFSGTFSEETRILITIGFLGAFTTMSTFSYESFRMLEQNRIFLLGANIVLTVTLTIFAVYMGKLSAVYLWSNV